MKHYLLVALATLPIVLFAQLTIEWQKMYGGTQSDQGYSIVQTNDGGYVIIGNSYSDDGDVSGHIGPTTRSDAWVVKTGADGMKQWEKSFAYYEHNIAFQIQQTNDGGYVFAGTTGSYLGNSNAWVVKLAGNGTVEWQKSVGNLDDLNSGISVKATTDGGYLVGGIKYDNYWLFKLNAQGTLQWEHQYGGTDMERLHEIALTGDGGCVLVGASWSDDGDVTGHHGAAGNGDYWVVKTDSLGNLQWEKSLGGTQYDEGRSIAVTPDNGYLVSGEIYSGDGNVTGFHPSPHFLPDTWVVKLNSMGIIQWQKVLGGTGYDGNACVLSTSDGGAIVAGYTGSEDGDISSGNHGELDAWFVKLNQSGQIGWQKLIGGSSSETINSLIQTSDGGYAFSGYSNSTDGDVTVSTHGSDDYWIVKLSPPLATKEAHLNRLYLYPNPSFGLITLPSDSNQPVISLFVSDILGNQIIRKKVYPGGDLDISALPAGTYFITGETQSGQILHDKIVKQ